MEVTSQASAPLNLAPWLNSIGNESPVKFDTNNNEYSGYYEVNPIENNYGYCEDLSSVSSSNSPQSYASCSDFVQSNYIEAAHQTNTAENAVAKCHLPMQGFNIHESDSKEECENTRVSSNSQAHDIKFDLNPICAILNVKVVVKKLNDNFLALLAAKQKRLPLKPVALKKKSFSRAKESTRVAARSENKQKLSAEESNQERKVYQTVVGSFMKIAGDRLECVKCRRTYSCIASFNRHINWNTCFSKVKKNVSVDDQIKCRKCNRVFGSNRGLHIHAVSCQKTSDSEKQSIQPDHTRRRKQNENIFKKSGLWLKIIGKNRCRTCGKFFESRLLFTRHKLQEICKKAERLKCVFCENMVSNTYFLRHLNYHINILNVQNQDEIPEDDLIELTNKRTLVKRINQIMNL